MRVPGVNLVPAQTLVMGMCEAIGPCGNDPPHAETRRGAIFDRISRARQKRPVKGFGTNLGDNSLIRSWEQEKKKSDVTTSFPRSVPRWPIVPGRCITFLAVKSPEDGYENFSDMIWLARKKYKPFQKAASISLKTVVPVGRWGDCLGQAPSNAQGHSKCHP